MLRAALHDATYLELLDFALYGERLALLRR
jgi:hypothetical protein